MALTKNPDGGVNLLETVKDLERRVSELEKKPESASAPAPQPDAVPKP